MFSRRPLYSKRSGTSGIRGALYETKLLSLLYFRAIHDDDIENFELLSNVDNLGQFNDICFKAKVKGFNKPFAVFIQARHRENKNKTLKIDLVNYFNSYMKIREEFHPSDRNVFFERTFHETECLFVIYTNAKIEFSDDSAESELSAKLKELIDTRGKLDKNEESINYRIISVEDQVTALAKRIAKLITDKDYFQILLTDEYVLRYHVILAQKVFDVSEIQAEGYRLASFRHDFYDTNEEYLIVFKETLFKEILKRRTITPADMKLYLSEFLDNPTDARRLSYLIGTVVTYNNGQLEFEKQSIKYFKPDMTPMHVSQSTVNKAVELATKGISSMHFKVPTAFGNKDLTLIGKDEKKERRINYLAMTICDLLYSCDSSKMVTIGEQIIPGVLQLNGGIAGAIGNVFVLDDNTKLMKITDNWESLEDLAKRLYTKLIDDTPDLHDYKFSFKVDKFPKLSFGEYEENLVRDFLNKLQFYCNQADEEGVEEILKDEIIEKYQHNQPHYYQVQTDAIFSEYHNDIQKWWMQPRLSYGLTRESNLFKHSTNNIIRDALMNSINLTYMNKLQQYNYTFTEDAVRSFNLQDQHSSTVIVAENILLTVVKVRQQLKKRHHVVLDVKYIATLPINDQNALRSELASTHEANVLILVCDNIESRNELKTLEDIAEAVRSKTIIIITKKTSLQMINIYFPKADDILHDKKLSLIDLSKESQESIFKTATATFPGGKMKLDQLLRGWPKTSIRSVGTAVASGAADKETATGSH